MRLLLPPPDPSGPCSGVRLCRLSSGRRGTTIIEGVLSEGTFTDANGQPEQAFILTPLLPTCLAGDDQVDQSEQVGEIQIISSNDQVAQNIKNVVGKDVFVQGTPSGADTVHHHAPIVMDISGILK